MTETQPRDPENKFVYSYSAPTAEERAEIESIRRSYRREAPDGMERLRLLDKAARRPAAWCSRVLGACGIALFGGGLALVFEANALLSGSLLAAAGAAFMAAAYPVYKLLFSRGKKKYGAEILRLSEEILHEKREDGRKDG